MVVYEGDRIRRGRDKIDLVVKWLFYYGCSTKGLLCEMLGLSKKGQSAFFKRLLEERIIEKVNAFLFREDLYRLTYEGYDYAKMLVPHTDVPRKRKIVRATMIHDLTVQREAIKRSDGLIGFKTERFSRAAEDVKCPDVTLDYKDSSIALEIELSHKNNMRVYYGFLSHLHSLKIGRYSRVIYLFGDKALLNNYKSKFMRVEWPVIRADSKKRLKRYPDVYMRNEAIDGYFSFELCDVFLS